MKFTQIALCALLVLVVVQAKPLAVKQGWDFASFFQDILDAVTEVATAVIETVSEVAGTVVAAVMEPVLNVVALVEEKIVAPIQNRITSAGLGLVLDQFCGMLPTLAQPLGFKLPTDYKDICLGAAKEELKKAFDSNWVEPARE
jgi:phage-related protein